jgi:citrate lyase beta subunit
MKESLSKAQTARLMERLRAANARVAERYPGDSERRRPIHTVYGGAHLFKAETPKKMGQVALRTMRTYAPTFLDLAHAMELPGHEGLPHGEAEAVRLRSVLAEHPERAREEHPAAWLAATVYRRVEEKLTREPVEDFRIDFEDGFGNRPDAEEDAEAVRCAGEVARGLRESALPPFIGIRIKPLNEERKERAVRTLDLFVTRMCEETGGRVPENFVVTLPKVTHPEQVSVLVDLLEALEVKIGLAPETLRLELMVETPQSILDHEGRSPLPAFVTAARGRCVAAHFGVYDYTASLSITAAHQSMTHPACDFARHAMQVALAGTGLRLSDGATNVLPVAPHRADGRPLTEAQARENREAVHRAWRVNAAHIRHSLRHAYYQGWDLHPAQLPVRYATVFAFFLEGFEAAAVRLRNFIEKAAQATLVGDVFDDAATGQALLNYFLRAVNCGAVTEAETERTGLTLEEIRTRSFYKILEGRRRAASASHPAS